MNKRKRKHPFKTIHRDSDWHIEQARNNQYFVTPLLSGRNDIGLKRVRVLKREVSKFI